MDLVLQKVSDGIAPDHLRGAVAAAVVDHQNFVPILRVILFEQRLYAIGDDLLAVVDGNDNRHEGFIAPGHPLPPISHTTDLRGLAQRVALPSLK